MENKNNFYIFFLILMAFFSNCSTTYNKSNNFLRINSHSIYNDFVNYITFDSYGFDSLIFKYNEDTISKDKKKLVIDLRGCEYKNFGIIKVYNFNTKKKIFEIVINIKELEPTVEINKMKNNSYFKLSEFKVQKGIFCKIKPTNSYCNAISYNYNVIRDGKIIYTEYVVGSNIFSDSILEFMKYLKIKDEILLTNIKFDCFSTIYQINPVMYNLF